jgi:UPF0716 family protein affecting phage T7 exclusion
MILNFIDHGTDILGILLIIPTTSIPLQMMLKMAMWILVSLSAAPAMEQPSRPTNIRESGLRFAGTQS